MHGELKPCDPCQKGSREDARRKVKTGQANPCHLNGHFDEPPGRGVGLELEWSVVATPWVFCHRLPQKGARTPFQGTTRVRGAAPGTETQSGHVKNGL